LPIKNRRDWLDNPLKTFGSSAVRCGAETKLND
jgi:hypothetical protein